MIKAAGKTEDGQDIVVFGLSHKNLDLLRQGKPIIVQMSEIGLQGEVLIFSGKTEGDCARMLGDMSARQTMGSICPDCDSARREDGSCNCEAYRI